MILRLPSSRFLVDLIYPPSCLNCNAPVENPVHFCEECLEHFTLLPLEGRCTKCFASIPTPIGTCLPCRKLRHPFRKVGACFDPEGPALKLASHFLEGGYRPVAKEIASYMVVQLSTLPFPEFDLITTVPSFFQQPLAPIGKELACLLGCPYKPLLRRLLDPKPKFRLKKGCVIINQKVLLIEMSFKQGDSFRAAGWALDKGRPENIYGMTFCASF